MTEKTIQIQGLPFVVEQPYAEGHVLTAPEAGALNQTYAENLRNNFAGRIKTKLDAKEKAMKEAGEEGAAVFSQEEIEELQVEFAKFADEYEFAGKRSTRAPVDPVAREAFKIAKGIVTAHCKKKDLDPKTIANFDQLVEQVAAKAEIQDAARRRVAELQSVGSDLIDGLI